MTGLSRVAVVGLGYIGLPTAVSLVTGGLEVIGVEVNPDIIERVNRDEAPFAEPDLSVGISGAVAMGRSGRSGRWHPPTPTYRRADAVHRRPPPGPELRDGRGRGDR